MGRMNTPNLEETRPHSVSPQPEDPLAPQAGADQENHPDPVQAPDGSSQGPELPDAGKTSPALPWKSIAILGVLILFIIGAISAYGGYLSGKSQRLNASSTQVSQQVSEQYALAMKDMDLRQYDLARQRLEWVIQQNPNYPGVIDKLAEVQLQMSITASPTIAPSPTLTPTPDLRSVEELYSQAQQQMAGGDWSTAIDTLLKLRKDASGYHAVDVDGMLYVALRERGVDKIKKSDLEGGTYDLALAERFGPLDVEAKNWREWATFYITGASFWEVDWTQVINYFSQLAPIVPNLMDGSGWTATDRLRIAYIRYGDQLAASGDFCKAKQQYDSANQVRPNPTIEPTLTYVDDKCATGGSTKKSKKTQMPTEEAPAAPAFTQLPAETPTPPNYP